MTTKHVPGPWKYHLGRGAKPRFHIQTEGGYQIASTTELTTRFTAKLAADFAENEAREANARLIAAAPELLEAAEWLMAELSSRFDYETATPEEETIFCHMESVIAKARGDK